MPQDILKKTNGGGGGIRKISYVISPGESLDTL
jgi:hypothetical protein